MMRVRWFMTGLFLLAGCGPDCTVAVPKLATCSEENPGARYTFSTQAQIDCDTGETPTYFECWEKVDNSNCSDATKICLQYAGQ